MRASVTGARYIAVEGPLGAGKAALSSALAERLGARLLREPTDNPFLQLFYEDRARSALSTQLHFLFARRHQQVELAQGDLFAKGGVVANYLPAKDLIYARLTLPESEFTLYQKVHALLAPRAVRPDLTIYLVARPEVLLGRIRRRSRPWERLVTLDFVEEVAQAYHAFFFHWAESPLLVVDDSEVDLDSDSKALDELLAVIRRHKGGVQHYIPLGSRR